MYHPLLVFDGDTDQLITAVLRPGNAHGSRGAVAVLRRLVAAPARALAGRRDRAARRQRLRRPGPVRLLRGASGSPTPSGWSPTPAWRRWPRRCWPRPQRAGSAEPDGAKVRLAGEAAYQAGQLAPRAPRRLQGRGAGQGAEHPLRRHHPRRRARWRSTTGTSTAASPRAGSRTSSAPASPTASAATASGPTSSACCSTPPPTGCSTPCAAGSPAVGAARTPARHPAPAPAQDRRPRPPARHPRPPPPRHAATPASRSGRSSPTPSLTPVNNPG